MATPSRILCLNLGMQTIGMAEFKTSSNGGLVLHAFRLTELLADPAAEHARLGQMQIAINEMRAALKVGGKVNYAIPAQAVFTRFVKLPTVGEEKVDQIIRFEAQQNVPFPIDEVVWDYQLVGSDKGGQMEVVLVAIKADMLEALNDTVEDCGLHVNTVDIGPMALYNAFRYNYSDMTGCSLLIDVGARTTNLIFIEHGKVFSRSIPIGGTTITQAVAKDFDEPFQVSEERKKRDGFIGLGGSFAEPEDADKARVAKVIRNSMTRLHAEISRSVSFYRSQQQGAQPVRAFLCGGSVSLPYTREFFAEKLNLPIEFFNPLRNVAVGSQVDMEEAGKSAHVLGELVGLGLRSISECPMELNLEPASVIKTQQLAKRRPYFIMAGLCLLLSLAAWWLYFERAATVTQIALDKMQPQIAALGGVEGQFKAVRADMDKAKLAAAPFTKAVSDRGYWVRMADELNARLPARFIWITVFEPGEFNGAGFRAHNESAGIVSGETQQEARESSSDSPARNGQPAAQPTQGFRLRGLYLDNPKQAGVVDDFVKNLSESPYVQEATAPVRTASNAEAWAYEYEIHVKLKPGFEMP